MLGLFNRNPTKKLRDKYAKLLEQGMHAQRNGDIRLYSELTTEAAAIWDQIQLIEKQKR